MKTTIILIFSFLIISISCNQPENDYFKRALAKEKLRDWSGAIADYSKAIEINPQNAEAYYNRGVDKGIIDDNRGAIEDFSKAIEIKPNYAEAYYFRGASKIFLDDKDGGCIDFRKAKELGDKRASDAISGFCQ
ncbi:MAG: tetratricopeptide repeat protein [Bacteroidetes bacterium]|nr:tetratricopeptide repeat protein [Bacteroidota bacterium]